jgi:hypothetical protein
MAEEKSAGGEIASGLRSIFDRVGEFFHIFDLSFFVSGVTTFAAFAFLYTMMQYPRRFPFEPWVGVVALIVACYVCGLMCFAAGRWLSGWVFRGRMLGHYLPLALAVHGLDKDATVTSYTGQKMAGLWRLYIRMWSEIADKQSVPVIRHHLMRYWAMAATYDGLAASFVVWAGVLIAVQFPAVAPAPLGRGPGVTGAVACLVAAVVAFRRGASFFEFQIEDLVAHFAVARLKLTPPPQPPAGQ